MKTVNTFSFNTKIALLLLFSFFIIGCSSDDSNSNDYDPNDIDGDGVTNQQEVVDGTDPENQCSFLVSSIYLPSASNTWKNSDCDGDGMTNRKEIDLNKDGQIDSYASNPLDGCSINLNEERDTTPSDEWKMMDCDYDAVSNGQELIDGTYYKSGGRCDLIVEHQDLPVTTGWKNTDCDGDNRNNAYEIYLGSNPLDPNDFIASMGDKITRIYRASSYGDVEKTWELTFSDNGTKLDKYFIEGVMEGEFIYDSSNRLITVNSSVDNNSFLVSFQYDDFDRISFITTNSVTKSYIYENNDISVYNDSGQLIQEITLNDMDKIESIRDYTPFYDINNAHEMLERSFEYYLEDLYRIFYREYIYDNTNDTYDLITPPDYTPYKSFSTREKPNFAFNAFNNIYMNYFLAPEILESFDYVPGANEGLFSSNLLSYAEWRSTSGLPPNTIVSISGSYGIGYQENDFIYTTNKFGSGVQFEYEY